MWPESGAPMGWMGFWMIFGWIIGLAVLVLLVWVVARAAGGFLPRRDEDPEQILKRRDARGEIQRDEYERRLDDLRK